MFPTLTVYFSIIPSMCKMVVLERKCADRAVRLRTALESQLNSGVSRSDMWDKTVSFFTVKKALIFHNGYNKTSREAMRLFPSPAEDVAPLCWRGHMQEDKMSNNLWHCVCVCPQALKHWTLLQHVKKNREKSSTNVKLLFFSNSAEDCDHLQPFTLWYYWSCIGL